MFKFYFDWLVFFANRDGTEKTAVWPVQCPSRTKSHMPGHSPPASQYVCFLIEGGGGDFSMSQPLSSLTYIELGRGDVSLWPRNEIREHKLSNIFEENAFHSFELLTQGREVQRWASLSES